MSVNRGRNGLDNSLADAIVLRELRYLSLILLGEAEGREQILLLVNMVRL